MGLIREPQNVDFTVLNKPWTEEEQKELSGVYQIEKSAKEKAG